MKEESVGAIIAIIKLGLAVMFFFSMYGLYHLMGWVP